MEWVKILVSALAGLAAAIPLVVELVKADTIDYDIDMDVISDLIDSLCNMSKVVNAPKA